MADLGNAEIPESYFEHKAEFKVPVFEAWTLPNPLVRALFATMKEWGTSLGDISWNKDPSTYKDFQMTFSVPRINAMVRVGLAQAEFIAVNPDWSKAPALVELFETVLAKIQETTGAEIASQEMTLAMHVTPGPVKFGELMARLVNSSIFGAGDMYGVSVYRQDSALIIDKSLRYDGAVFVRLHRRFPASISFTELATIVYHDEVNALSLLGLQGLIQAEV